jgi:uncharacterized protein (TIGR02284 family)
MEHDLLIDCLNHLIAVCKAGEENFRRCTEDTSNTQLKSLFSDRAQSCATSSRELQDMVRNLGGRAETRSSVGSVLQQHWRGIKGSIFGKDDAIVLDQCERCEEAALDSYREAMTLGLPLHVKRVLERHYQGVQQDHEQIRRLHAQVLATD